MPVTVTATVPVFPSTLAVTLAEPGLTARMIPVWDTVATLTLDDAHATDRPVTVLPAASLMIRLVCVESPVKSASVEGETVTVATGTTAILALPLLPSLVAVTVALPFPTAVTSPVAPTVTTDGFELLHVTLRPTRFAPALSFGDAVSCTVCPTPREAVAGVTATEATGTGMTEILAEPLRPPAVAVMVAVPMDTPVTTPVEDTVALVMSLELHTTGNVAPGSAVTVAVSLAVDPSATGSTSGVTDTACTPRMVSGTLPLALPEAAVIVTLPRVSPVTCPVLDTDATAPSDDVQLTVAPGRTEPLDMTRAVSCCVPPAASDELGAETSIVSGTATVMA
jgi:hypothetical protein